MRLEYSRLGKRLFDKLFHNLPFLLKPWEVQGFYRPTIFDIVLSGGLFSEYTKQECQPTLK